MVRDPHNLVLESTVRQQLFCLWPHHLEWDRSLFCSLPGHRGDYPPSALSSVHDNPCDYYHNIHPLTTSLPRRVENVMAKSNERSPKLGHPQPDSPRSSINSLQRSRREDRKLRRSRPVS